MTARADAQRRVYELNARPLTELDAWLSPYRELWERSLDALERTLDGDEVERPYPPERWRGYYEEYQQRGFPAGAVVPGDM